MTERQFQDAVVELGNWLGWSAFHARTSRTGSGGHATAVAYQGVGFPDLVLVRERVVFAELKSARGRLSDAQRGWIKGLRDAGAEVYVWRPRDWPEVEEVLGAR